MACNLEETQAAACSSGIGKESNPISLLQVIAQLSCELSEAAAGNEPGLPLTSVQFNDGGVFGGDSNFTFNKTTDTLTIPNIGSPAATALQFASAGTNRANFSTAGHLLFNTDNTNDIGASGATRPRRGYFGTELLAPLVSIAAAANANALAVTGYSLTGANAQSMLSLAGTLNTSGTPNVLDLNITDTASNANTNLLNLRVGGGSVFRVRKDGSTTTSGGMAVGAGNSVQFTGRAVIQSTADSILLITNSAQTGFNRLNFGGSAATFPSLKRSSTVIQARLANDSAFTELECSNIITNNAAAAFSTNTTLTDNAGAGGGTLLNAPTAGNPTKWIGIDDNGTTRFIPTWT